MVKYVGELMQRPYIGVSIFEVDGEFYGIGSMHYDSTNTRKVELYDMFLLALYKLSNVVLTNEAWGKFGKKVESADFEASKPLAKYFVNFTNTFGHLFEYEADGETLTHDSREKYIHEENEHIQRFLVSGVFNNEHQMAIRQMLTNVYEY